MKKLIIALCATAFPFAALADDPNSKAKNWNLVAQKKAVFTGKVVDVRCEVTGNCADECGAGAYHLGILTTDGKLIPTCLLYTSPSPRDLSTTRMPSSA